MCVGEPMQTVRTLKLFWQPYSSNTRCSHDHLFSIWILKSLAFQIVLMVNRHIVLFQSSEGMIIITQLDFMLWFTFHRWVISTYIMRIIWCWCFPILCKGLYNVGFMRVFLRNLLLPLQISLKYFWGSGIMMEMILNHSILNYSLRPIWSTSFIGKRIIWKISRYLVSTWYTILKIRKSMIIPLRFCMKSHSLKILLKTLLMSH